MFLAARWRLTIVFTGVLVGILAAAGAVVFLTTESLLYDQVDAELSDKAHQDEHIVKDDYKPDYPGGHGDGGGGRDPKEFDPGGYSYSIMDPDGTVTEGSSYVLPATSLETAIDKGHAIVEVGSGDDQQRVYILAVDTNDGTQLLAVGRSIESEKDTLTKLRNILLVAVLGSIGPGLLGGYVLSGRALRPIKRSIDSQRAFIADASHELRTPVAVVRTNAELLERHIESGKLGQAPSDTRAVQDIISETERMNRLVGQMLTLAEVDAGQAILTQQVIRLDELADEVVRSMRALAEAKGIELAMSTTPGVWVNGDRDRLREVMVTLLDNAIKYTDVGGKVRFDVQRSNRRAVVKVSDTGQGIAPEALEHVFERFFRADKARSREEGGTGLGLAIARHIVNAHGGEIEIESEPGKGTTVTVELKLLGRESATEPSRLPEAT